MTCCKCMWLQTRKNAAVHVMPLDKFPLSSSWIAIRAVPETDRLPSTAYALYLLKATVGVPVYTRKRLFEVIFSGVSAVTDGRRKITARSNYRLTRRLSKFCLMSLAVSAYEPTTVSFSVRSLTPCVLWRTLFVSLDLRTFCRLQDLC